MFGGIGSLLSGIGGIASAFGGGGSNYKGQVGMMNAQARISREDIPLRVKAYTDAGIHPLYGMSGQQFTPTPVTVGEEPSAGERLAHMGQNISRAASAYTTSSERAFKKASDALTLENMKLQNDLLRAQTTAIGSPSNPPIPGPSDVDALAGQSATRGLPGYERHVSPDAGFSRTRNGDIAVVPSQDVKNRIEDMAIPEIQWYLRQAVTSSPDGYVWNPLTSTLSRSKPDDFTAPYVYLRDKKRQFERWIRDR